MYAKALSAGLFLACFALCPLSSVGVGIPGFRFGRGQGRRVLQSPLHQELRHDHHDLQLSSHLDESLSVTKTLVLVHITHTSSSALERTLQDCLGRSRVCMDLSEHSPATHPAIRWYKYHKQNVSELAHSGDCRAITCGDTSSVADFVVGLGVRNAVAVLRHPLERIFASYKWTTEYERSQRGTRSILNQTDVTSFAANVQSDVQVTKLMNIPVEAFGLVGTSEDIETTLHVAENLYQIPLAPGQGWVEEVSIVRDPRAYPATLERFLNRHRKDLDAHQRAGQLLQERARLQEGGWPFAHGGIDTCHESTVGGWAWWEKGEDVVELEIECGSTAVAVDAGGLRQDLRHWNTPRGGWVGFHVRCKCTGSNQVRVARTGQVLRKLASLHYTS